MKSEYQDYLDELLDERRRLYTTDPTDRMLLTGACTEFTKKFVQKFPHLRRVPGFYGGYTDEEFNTEHWWCVDIDGTIVDPTVRQFRQLFGEYIEFDENIHKVRIGRCMICGDDIFGKPSDGHGACCCSEECAKEFD